MPVTRRSLRPLLAAVLLTGLVAPAVGAQHQDVITTARNAGQFATLLAAVDAAGLTQTLRGKGPYTVFAPSDEAFRKLPAGTVESLLRPENRERLQAILTYHVLPGRVSAATARTLSRAETVEGRAIRIRASGNTLRINDATVRMADVGASNGVIHVIDEVLMPEDAATSAGDLIALAVERGVPLYNDGQPGATVAVYEVAARAVLTLGEAVPATARTALERGLRDAERERDLDERAWVLRRALDAAARALDGRRMMTDGSR